MIRVVGGAVGGRSLRVPPRGTRPTSERAREAMFNSLASLIELDGAIVLDLFAGSGAVGIEALSRGARQVVFVDVARSAVRVIEGNIESMDLPGATVRCGDAAEVVSALGRELQEPFDLVFADPPYEVELTEVEKLVGMLVEVGLLADGGVLVVERPARERALTWPSPVSAVRHKRYGEGVLWYGRLQ